MKLEKGIYENLIDSKLAADIKVSEENGLINDYLLWDNRGKGGGATGVIAKYGDKDFL